MSSFRERFTLANCGYCLKSFFVCAYCPHSRGKTLAIIPFWPIVGIGVLVAGGMALLLGIGEVTRGSSGTETEDDFIKLNKNVRMFALGFFGVIVVIDLLITYSVFSSKMRIHNIGYFSGECSGFMASAEGCRGKCLSVFCKGYTFLLHFFSWLTTLLSLTLCVLCVLIASVCLGGMSPPVCVKDGLSCAHTHAVCLLY